MPTTSKNAKFQNFDINICQLATMPQSDSVNFGNRGSKINAKMIPDVKFIEKRITNFSAKFGDFSLRKELLLFLGMSFLVTDITEYSNEAKDTWKWVNTAKIQIELIMVPSKMRNCAVPPDLFHSEISFTSTCNIPKHRLSKKTRRR